MQAKSGRTEDFKAALQALRGKRSDIVVEAEDIQVGVSFLPNVSGGCSNLNGSKDQNFWETERYAFFRI